MLYVYLLFKITLGRLTASEKFASFSSHFSQKRAKFAPASPATANTIPGTGAPVQAIALRLIAQEIRPADTLHVCAAGVRSPPVWPATIPR